MLKRLRVVRVETTSDNNRRIIGLFVPKEAVDTVLQGLFLSLSILIPFLKSTPAHAPALMVCFHRRNISHYNLYYVQI